MNVHIINPEKLDAVACKDSFCAVTVFMDEQKHFAVAEVLRNELFIALKVVRTEKDLIVGEYVDRFSFDDDVPSLYSFSVDWSCLKYGFCKLVVWAPEMVNKFGGSFSQTVKRFYFDREQYKNSYEAVNGVPYPGGL